MRGLRSRIDPKKLYTDFGYFTHSEVWEVLKDPESHESTASFLHLGLHLVPEDVEPFRDVADPIRLIANDKMKEQRGAQMAARLVISNSS